MQTDASDAANAESIVQELFYGRWRSQTVYAALRLGVFDAITATPQALAHITTTLGVDAAHANRLLRVLASMGLLREDAGPAYAITAAGELLKRGHPRSLRDAFLLREGPEHTAVWKHLADIVRDGNQNGFVREFGALAFDYAVRQPSYEQAFNAGMSSQSTWQTRWTLDALAHCGLQSVSHVCDIGGGHGHLLAHVLHAYPHLRGTLFDRPGVTERNDRRWARELGVEDRCTFIGGDMFADVPAADVYTMKMILHDWNDAECGQILQNLARRAPPGARLFVIEHVIPATGKPDYAALFDMHMMCWGSGSERTEREYAALLEASQWKVDGTHYPAGSPMGVVEAHLAV